MSDKSLINIGELSKPATVLIEKISEAVGGVFKPYQIVRVAKAEAEAELINAKAQIEVSELQRRAMHRFLIEEAHKQSNIESITEKALPLLTEESSPEKLENDWIANFFDKSRIVSDDEMQTLWSRLLANEANEPGSFSRRTVNLLADLDKRDAELFVRLCGFVWNIGDLTPLVFNVADQIYKNAGLTFGALNHLDTLGLIKFDNIAGFVRMGLNKKTTAFYYGTPVNLTLQNENDNQIKLGKVLLTIAGQELAPICGSAPVQGFLDYVCDYWAKLSYSPTREPASQESTS